MKKIIVSGVGGQGVRVIAHTLATLLVELGYEVGLLYDYDSTVRGEMSVAYLTYDDKPVTNPVIQEADIMLKLANKAQGLVATKTVCETGLCTDEEIPFSQWGIEKFGKEIFGNMIALGRLLKLVGLEVSEKDLERALPRKFREENLKAVQYGYNLKEEDLQRGRISTQLPCFDHVCESAGTARRQQAS